MSSSFKPPFQSLASQTPTADSEIKRNELIPRAWRACWNLLSEDQKNAAIENVDLKIVPLDTVDWNPTDEDSTCDICREAYINNPPVTFLNLCGHYFDVACMERQMKNGGLRCPECQQSLVPQSKLDSLFQGTSHWSEYCDLLEASKTDRTLLCYNQIIEETFLRSEKLWNETDPGPDCSTHQDHTYPAEDFDKDDLASWEDPRGVDTNFGMPSPPPYSSYEDYL